MKRWSTITPAVILALGLAISGCGSGEKTTSGNQNSGNPSNSSQNSSSGSNAAGSVQQNTPESSTQGTPSTQTSDQPMKLEVMNQQMASIGSAELKKAAEGVEIKLNLTELTPGKHGIHFHQIAKCEGPEFKSAGEHFNPEQKKHGLDSADGGHAGDLPNIAADAGGKVSTTIISKTTTLDKGKTNSLVGGDGKSLIIHAQTDDGKTDPSGNSGERVGCAIIK